MDVSRCPRPVEMVMKVLRIAAILFAVVGPFFLWLLVSAMNREIKVDNGVIWMHSGECAAIIIIGVSLALLANYTLAGKMWAFSIVACLLGLGVIFLAAGVFIKHTLGWYSLIGPAIVFCLLIIPFNQYRRYSESQSCKTSVPSDCLLPKAGS